MSARYPDLELLLAGYFHQDFELESGDPHGALRRFLRSEPEGSVRACAEQIDALLAACPDESALAHAVLGLGCYYASQADGYTVRGWLESVARTLRRN